MANLKELLVNGVSRFIGKVYINDSHITTINGVTVTESPKFTDTTALGSMTGTLGVGNGGTGKTNGKDAANYFINALDTGSSTPADNDYYVSQYVNGGTSTTTYHRRPMSALWTYIKGKIDNNGSYTNKNVFGKVKVGSTTIEADTTQDTLELTAGTNITLTPDSTNDKITITATDTTYSDVVAGGVSGLMTGADKTKLNNIEANANNYTHPIRGNGSTVNEGFYRFSVTDTGHIGTVSSVFKSDLTSIGIADSDTVAVSGYVSNGQLVFRNSSNNTVFTVYLPLYNGEIVGEEEEA